MNKCLLVDGLAARAAKWALVAALGCFGISKVVGQNLTVEHGDTYSVTGDQTFDNVQVGSYGGDGTIDQSSGTFKILEGFILGRAIDASAIGTYNLSGGILSADGVAVGAIGVLGSTFNQTGGTFATNGGEIDINSGAAYNLTAGLLSVDTITTADDGSFIQNGGSLTTKGGTPTLPFGNFTLSGGVITTGIIAGNDSSGQTVTSTFNFNGGTIQANASDNPQDPDNPTMFLSNLTTANVQTGGIKVDTQDFNVTISQNLLHNTTLNAAPIDGGLVKTGSGRLALTGENTYTGPTVVNAGTLLASNISGSATGTGTVLVNSGATLGGGGTITGAVQVADVGTLAPSVVSLK